MTKKEFEALPIDEQESLKYWLPLVMRLMKADLNVVAFDPDIRIREDGITNTISLCAAKKIEALYLKLYPVDRDDWRMIQEFFTRKERKEKQDLFKDRNGFWLSDKH